jgi:hypothetical protein
MAGAIAEIRIRGILSLYRLVPRAGAEYFGGIAKISVGFGLADDAGHRATLAAHFASIVLASHFVGVELAAAMADPDLELED